MPDFDGKHVVVTGGGGALGGAVVERLVAAGATVHVPSIAEVEPHLVDREHVVTTPHVDLSDDASVAAFYESVGGCWASIHVAGGFAMAPLADTSLDDLRRLIDINLVTAFLCCRAALGAIREGGEGGRIVNIAARPALVPTGGMAAYAATKAAVSGLTLSLSEELAGEGIFVNAVVPSIMDTPANRAAMPDADHAQWPSVDAVAATIVFLASSDNACTRGGLVPVYGRS